MKLPPKTRSQRRMAEPPSSSGAKLHWKVKRVIESHEETKSAFAQLKAQIKIGLREADHVFGSLAGPLMQLVGLKAAEMASEGRFTSFIIHKNTDSTCPDQDGVGSGSTSGSNRNRVEICAAKAANQVLEKQKDQVIELVTILKQMKPMLNNQQRHMAQTLADHRLSLQKLFQHAVAYLSSVDRSDQQGLLVAMSKVLRAIFREVGHVLGLVENNVDDLILDLAKQMCEPMMEYAKGMKEDATNGSCKRLVDLVKEMAKVARDSSVELEEAKSKVRVAEESRAEAVRRLREAQDNLTKLKGRFNLLPGPSQPPSTAFASPKVATAFASHKVFCMEKDQANSEKLLPRPSQAASTKVTTASTTVTTVFASQKVLCMEKDQANDEKLLWDLLEKKRKYQTDAGQIPESPDELHSLQHFNTKRQKPTNEKPSVRSSYSLRSRECGSVFTQSSHSWRLR